MVNADLLNKSRSFLKTRGNTVFVYKEQGRNKKATPQKGSKALLFKNFLNCPGKEGQSTLAQSALYLASGLRKHGFASIFSDSRISPENGCCVTDLGKLRFTLARNPDINIICIPLCEDYFLKANELVAFLKKETNAFIGVGGTMPTLSPEHVFAHMPGVNFLLRGSGEEALVRIARALKDKNTTSELDSNTIRDLSGLSGFIFRANGYFISAEPDKINHIYDLDRSYIDFSLLSKEDLSDGLILYTARGCRNKCFFCTTFGHGAFRGKSAKELSRICDDYLSLLPGLFEGKVPAACYKISFYDDDFLADPERALKFFDYLKNTPLKIKFFQAGIRSFSEKKVLGRIDRSLFDSDDGHVYIGTENFCDAELARLGKGYFFKQIQEVVTTLSAKRIKQFHHLILTNHLTTPQEVIENLYKIAALQHLHKPYFNILTPIIPYLVSLYPSKSYQIAKKMNRLKYLNTPETLSLKGHKQYDYPLVKNDIPINALTRRLVPIVERSFESTKDHVKVLDETLYGAMLLSNSYPGLSKAITRLLDEYIHYPKSIKRDSGAPLAGLRDNIQLMVTRRCQLRCRYCPIIKTGSDMDKTTALASVELLFSSQKKDLRLDFTGGEPLLRFDLVKDAVIHAKSLARRHNKNISFYMVTNLIPLTDEMADFLAAERFFLELSVDGIRRSHNLYKKSCDKRLDPYRETTQQLKKIFLRGIANCAVMVVSPKTVRRLASNLCHLIELGFTDIGVNYALGSIWTTPVRHEFFRQLEMLKMAGATQIAEGRLRLNNLRTRNEPAILNSEVMVDVSGKVRFLTDCLFEKDNTARIPIQGMVSDITSFDEIFISPAIVLHRLLKYNNTPKKRRVIFNNIEMGSYAKQYFDSWKNSSKTP